MRHVIRYLLEGDGSVPPFVATGGFYQSGEELVGVSVDDAKRHLPLTVVKLTRADLVARIQATDRDREGNLPSQEEAESRASAFLAAQGMSDYA